MIRFNEHEIRTLFSRPALENGRQYLNSGLVTKVLHDDDGTISGAVQGSERRPYLQSIVVNRGRSGKLSVSGWCSCPVNYNCKHVAAVLLSALRPTTNARSAPAPIELSPDIVNWLRTVEAAGLDDDGVSPEARGRVVYLCNADASGTPSIQLIATEFKKNGEFSARQTVCQIYDLVIRDQRTPILRSSDKEILNRLQIFGGLSGPRDEASQTLRRIIATGRARWGDITGPAMSEGPAVSATLAWHILNDGAQVARLDLPDPLQTVRLSHPWYANTMTGVMGPVETGLPGRLVQSILAAPALPPALIGLVKAGLAKALSPSSTSSNAQVTIPTPIELPPPRSVRDKLRPRLELLVAELPFDPFLRTYVRNKAPVSRPGPHRVPLARLLFRYGRVVVQSSATVETLMHEGELLALTRSRRAESAAADRLDATGLKELGFYHGGKVPPAYRGDRFMLDEDSSEQWFDFVVTTLPLLRDDGWEIEFADDFPYRIAVAEGPITAELRPSKRPGSSPAGSLDWLDLDLGVMVDGQRVDLVPALLKLIRSGQADALRALSPEAAAEAEEDVAAPPLLLPLADGRLLSIPFDRIRPILGPLLELFEGRTGSGPLRISRFDAADLAAAEATTRNAGIVWNGGDAIRNLGRQLRDAGGIPRIAVPDSFTATLRPYQAHGVDWMGFLRAAGLGGVLADDMGLGKTVQALAHLTIEQKAGRLDRPSLLVCPTSLVPNWRAEAERFAPTLRVLILHGKDRATRFDAIPEHDLVITTYPLLARDHETLGAQKWHIVLLDEAQTIKNPAATTSQLARTLQARQRLCLSGTPLENHLGELWSLFDFVMPGFLGDQKGFGRRFRTPIEKAGDRERQSQLARRIGPFLLRRTKDEVAADLPPKTEISEMVEMDDAQRAVYEAIRLAMHAKVQSAIADRGLARSGIVILEALLKLRQACCDPRLLQLGSAKGDRAGSAKLDRLMELLPPMLEEGRSVLLFSQFTSMLALIEAELAKYALPHVLLTGDTKDRATPVRQFQAGEANLFLISLKAGGTGLNLTAADTVIHYDPWWNPAVEAQATDRAHRIGQQKPVFVHRLVMSGTIEEKMEQLKARKQALVTGILGAGPGGATNITESDLQELLGPLA